MFNRAKKEVTNVAKIPTEQELQEMLIKAKEYQQHEVPTFIPPKNNMYYNNWDQYRYNPPFNPPPPAKYATTETVIQLRQEVAMNQATTKHLEMVIRQVQRDNALLKEELTRSQQLIEDMYAIMVDMQREREDA